MKNIKALRLTNITRYEDVEEGQLVLTINDHEKSWKAIWLSVLLHSVNGGLSLPRKTYMWIEPLNCCSWIDMGVNLYLCSSAGWPEPLPRYDYKNFVQALLSYNISEITIDEPIVTITNSRFHPNNIMGMEDFWDK